MKVTACKIVAIRQINSTIKSMFIVYHFKNKMRHHIPINLVSQFVGPHNCHGKYYNYILLKSQMLKILFVSIPNYHTNLPHYTFGLYANVQYMQNMQIICMVILPLQLYKFQFRIRKNAMLKSFTREIIQFQQLNRLCT